MNHEIPQVPIKDIHFDSIVTLIGIWLIHIATWIIDATVVNMPDALLWCVRIIGGLLAAWASIEVIQTNRNIRKAKKHGHK